MEEPKYHLSGVLHAGREASEDFDGPLDVILLLLSKNKIAIQDVSITSILDQYLAWLEERKRMDLEITSDFIDMASHLMLIKTKMLLSAAEQEEALSEMEKLIRSLQERQREEAVAEIRKAASFLEGRNDLGRGAFPKGQEPLPKPEGYQYRHSREDLLSALAAIADRGSKRLPPPASSFEGIVSRDPYPVSKKSTELLRKLLLRGISKLRKLFTGCASRSEIVATFLAVLELCKTNDVELTEERGEPAVKLIRVPEKRKEASHGA